jgi:hypothetical protein
MTGQHSHPSTERYSPSSYHLAADEILPFWRQEGGIQWKKGMLINEHVRRVAVAYWQLADQVSQ